MARVLQARRFSGWLAASVMFGAAGCFVVDKNEDDVGDDLTPAPAPTSTGPSTAPAGAVSEVFTLVNEARAQPRNCGGERFAAAPPLRWNDRLARAAQAHSEDMAAKNYFNHVAPDGTDMSKRVAVQGYTFSALGENIAAGQRTAAEVVQGWLESPGHCANIMNRGFRELGVGRAEGGSYEVYWTQNFGSPR